MADGKFLFLELGEKKISRVNLIANVVDKYVSDGDKKYAALTLDDASGQIKLKSFGDEIAILKDKTQGDTVQVIGTVREYNSELYVLPEIVKKIDAQWLLVRKLEIQDSRKDIPINKNAPVRDIVLDKIKIAEAQDGIDTDKLILDIEASPDMIKAEIKRLLEDGLIYEPRPGRLRYLG